MNASATPRVSGLRFGLLMIILACASAVQAQQIEPTEYDKLIISKRYKEALQLAEREYAAAKAGDNPLLAYVCGVSVAKAEMRLGKYDRAERLLIEAINAFLTEQGPDNIASPLMLTDLGDLYVNMNRLGDAEAILRRAVADNERVHGLQSDNLANACNSLGVCLNRRKEYGEASKFIARAMAIYRVSLGATHPITLRMQLNLSGAYANLGYKEQALAIMKEVVDLCRRSGERADSVLGEALLNLGNFEYKLDRYKEAQTHLEEAIAVSSKTLGPDNPELVDCYRMLAGALIGQGRGDEATPHIEKAVSILEKVHGTDSFQLAEAVLKIGAITFTQDRYEETERYLNRSLAILKKSNGPPGLWSQLYTMIFLNHAQIGQGKVSPLDWEYGHRCLEMLEVERASIRNSRDRSMVLAENSFPYEMLVERRASQQTDMTGIADVFSIMERYHARELLDEMSLAGADRDAGLSSEQRELKKNQEAELHRRISDLEGQLSKKTKGEDANALRSRLSSAREDLYDFYRDATTNSPVYKAMFSRKTKLPELDEIMSKLLKPGDLLLEYLVGDFGTYVLAVTTEKALIQWMTVNEQESAILGVPQGKLTGPVLRQAFVNDKKTGLIQQLADPRIPVPTAKLKFMWETVVPVSFHKPLTDGTIKRLIVIPSGPLAMFPFETLLTEGPNGPAYLLDSGPPIITAPSAAVMLSLASKPPVEIPAGREPVLTVGDPAYPLATAGGAARDAAGARFSMAGGRLARLPFSGTEARWVSDAFREAGSSARLLIGETATEAAVRTSAPGRKIVHLACHGLADEALDNFFASLALAPGPQGATNPADDGFLTLNEIYGIDLSRCELAILSACQTNFGPQQKGEGTLSLSRGFLIAGARRVIASNWLVDDQAAANLISAFCSEIADSGKAAKPPEYAKTLQAAKRSIRRQEQWQAPYYWASLQMVGAP